jgi:exopolysaccharide biosynthesis polyprenyl glycosylphosphotransferase
MTALASDTAEATRGAASSVAVGPRRRRPWRRLLPGLVVVGDLGAGLVAVAVAVHLRYPRETPDLHLGGDVRADEAVVCAGVAVGWVAVLAAHRVYRSSHLGSGPHALAPVLRSGLAFFALLAAAHLLVGTDVSGRLLIAVVVLVVFASLLVHLVVDRIVHHAHVQGWWRQRAVVLGPALRAHALAERLRQDPDLAVDVVATFPLSNGAAGPPGTSGVRMDGGTDAEPSQAGTPARDIESLRGLAVDAGADVVAVTGGIGPAQVRSLAWALEGTGTDLLVAPAAPGLSDRRVAVEPMAGVPLLRVEPSRLTRGRLAAKAVIDRVGAAALIVLLSPVILAAGACVRLSGPGPVIFRQVRVGQHGVPFELLKFRTMVADADDHTAELVGRNEADGLLFKLRMDPRVTRIGRWMRRLSVDELPQLWNVVRGDMSVVGPRPLPVPADALRGDARRRLRVKPGITGLWQVSGRSELSWAETVRLDVRYVDRWSLGLDLLIMLRTPVAVMSRRGAY